MANADQSYSSSSNNKPIITKLSSLLSGMCPIKTTSSNSRPLNKKWSNFIKTNKFINNNPKQLCSSKTIMSRLRRRALLTISNLTPTLMVNINTKITTPRLNNTATLYPQSIATIKQPSLHSLCLMPSRTSLQLLSAQKPSSCASNRSKPYCMLKCQSNFNTTSREES